MTNSSNPPPQLIDELKHIVGSDRVSVDANDLETYGRDWTRVYAPAPSAVVFPGTTQEVAALVRACATHKYPSFRREDELDWPLVQLPPMAKSFSL